MSLTLETTNTIDPADINRGCRTAPRQKLKRPLVRTFPLFMILLLVPWTFDGARIIRQGVQTALRPIATCGTEMHILDGVACVARGEPLYPPMDGLPLAYHLYNPLTYLPAGWIGRCWGLDLDGLLVAGRCVSLASLVGLLALVAWYMRRSTGNAWLTALAPAMVLYFHSSTLTDFFRNRPETPAILLSLTAWMIARFRPRGWTALCAVACVATMAFKPTFVAAPLAIALQLACERRFRALFEVMSISLALGLAVVCGSYLLLGEGYFEHTVWAMMSNPMQPIERSFVLYPLLAQMHWGWLLPAALCSAAWLTRRRTDTPLLIYLAVCFSITTIAHGKIGSDLNYHGELSFLMVLTTLTAIARMHAAEARFIATPLLCLLAGTWSAIAAYGPTWNQLSLNRSVPHPYVDASLDEIPDPSKYLSRYAPHRGRVLILDDEISVHVGDPVVYDWYGLSLLFDSGHVRFETLENTVREQRYAVIVLGPLPTSKWSIRLRNAALASGYRLTRQDDRVEEYTSAGTR
ncbi:MAG: hypothetical protein WD894_00180 [Pirellulales bacterium]